MNFFEVISYFLHTRLVFPFPTKFPFKDKLKPTPSAFSSSVYCLQSAFISFLSRNNTFWLDPAAIHAGEGMLIDALHKLLNRIRKKKEITGEWKNGLLVKLPEKELMPLQEQVHGDHVPGNSKRTVIYRQYEVWIS